MSRYALWRRGTRDLQKSLKVASKDLSPDEVKRVRQMAVAFAVYLLVAVSIIWRSPERSGFFVPLFNVFWAFVSFGLPKSPTEPEEGAKEPEEGLRVRIKVLDQRGRKTGSDAGWLVHCDGWLLFEGDHTRFSFTGAEAHQQRYDALGNLSLEDGRSVEFNSYDENFSHLIREWERAPIPEGESILPPLEVHPDVWAAKGLNWLTFGVVFFGLSAAPLLLKILWLWATFTIAGLGCLSLWRGYVRRTQQEWTRIPESAETFSIKLRPLSPERGIESADASLHSHG